MSYQIVSGLWIELVDHEQEFLTGGIDIQRNSINFEQSLAKQTMTQTKQGQTNVTNTYTQKTECRSSAESSLSINPVDASAVAAPVNSSVVLP